ncbi:DUF4168 domain-containing protein [Chamaesiphon minutus]|uniref:DUF4168 domain-containing protein n=1 Tax=Chamaesiphon minutus (strain ATCC 27169 / PCC 6605) TaxID=1173020 RepID=K9UCN3_CHAP6|nr:DUF4168 domain-containing protein [Chamaesiphon minutus]AFY92847.1 hypothetical protein Cha6605_1722 [Chamaesiphon minutus PCC 6605]
MTTPRSASQFYRSTRPLLLGILTGLLGILSGTIPDLAASQPSLLFATVARADEFKDPELRNYAATILEIESIRQSALAQVSRANGKAPLPNLICSQPTTMESLNSEAKSLFVRYCNQSETIAAKKGLSIDRFNYITQAVHSSLQLQNRVRSLMMN